MRETVAQWLARSGHARRPIAILAVFLGACVLSVLVFARGPSSDAQPVVLTELRAEPAVTMVLVAPQRQSEVESVEKDSLESDPSTKFFDAPCTLHVDPNGSDGSDGRDAERALQSPAAAVNAAGPGDVVCFAPGVYRSPNDGRGALDIRDKHGADGQPIIFRSADRDEPAVLTMGSVESGRGVSVVFLQRSSHITVDGFEITEGFRGVTGNGVNNVRILNSKIHRTGGEVVSISRRVGRVLPDARQDPVSSFVEISGNEIAFSGLANGEPFGEGIYLGTSEPSFKDDTNHIVISDNHIHDLVDEAIDSKTGVWAVSIIDNRVENIEVNSQAAITLSLRGENWRDGNFLVTGNTISGVTTRKWDGDGIWVGHGNAIVQGNVIWDVADAGIHVPNTFNMSQSNEVVITENIIWNSGRRSIGLGDNWNRVPSMPPLVRLNASNQTWDGIQQSTTIDGCAECVHRTAATRIPEVE